MTNTENFLETYNARFLEVLVKEKLLGYFLVLWSAYFILAIFQELLEDSSSSFAYTGVNIILSLTIIAMAVVLVLLGRKVLGSSTIVSVKQKLLGYFLVLWGAGWFLNAILNSFSSYDYWENIESYYNIIPYTLFIATAVVLVLLGRKVLGSQTKTST